MIISRKKYEQDIKIAVEQAMAREDERRWQEQRLRDIGCDVDRRMERYERRLMEIEQKVFPERYAAPRCPMEVRDVAG